MPIPSQSTTNISLGPTLSSTSRSISAEFGDSSPHSASEFRRGGTRVADHPINASVPTSGTVSFSQYNGASIVYRYTISTSTQNLDLFAYASSASRPVSQNISQGYDQERRYVANQPGYGIDFVIGPGVIIGSAARTQTSLVTGSDGASGWHPTVKIRVINQGTILGAGGTGGNGAAAGPAAPIVNAQPGLGGGTAFDAQRPVAIDNASGVIAGGGGGGGGGGAATAAGGKATDPLVGGGGGGGAGQTGGSGGISPQPYVNQSSQPGNGATGTPTSGGAGGAREPGVSNGGDGGAGGGRGQTGGSGQNASAGSQPANLGAAGGAAGYYILNNGNVTWIANGTQQGQPG